MSQTTQERDEQVLHGGRFTTEANFNWLPLRDLESTDEPTGEVAVGKLWFTKDGRLCFGIVKNGKTKIIDLLRPINRLNKTDKFTTTSTKKYLLSETSDIVYPQEIQVTLGGVPQIPGTDYTYDADSNSISLVETPPVGIILAITYLKKD